MPHTVEISDSTQLRLQNLMGPEDTSGTAIARLLDFYESCGSKQGAVGPVIRAQSDALQFEGLEVPDLTHTRLLRATVDGKEVARPKWNKLRQMLIVRAAKEGADIKNWGVPGLVIGKKDIHGFSFVPAINMSIQGQAANDAWRSTLDVARRLGWNVEAICEWYQKVGASYPGKTAKLTSGRTPAS